MQYEALVEQLFFQLTPAVTFVRTSGYITSALQVRTEAYDAKRIGFNLCYFHEKRFVLCMHIYYGRKH